MSRCSVLNDPTNYCAGDVQLAETTAASSSLVLLKSAIFHTFDAVRILGVTQALFSRWLYQLFVELERYNRAPSEASKKTWISTGSLVISFFLMVMVKLINQRSSVYPAAQDYLFAAFSSSIVYFLLDMVVSSGKVGSITLPGFVAVSLVGVPILVGFFMKMVIPDSLNRLTGKIDTFALPYPSVTRREHTFNIISGLSYGVPALSASFWCLNRELNNGTVPLAPWQMGLLSVATLTTGKVGYELTNHPKFFQRFAQLSKLLRDAALSSATTSGICYSLVMHLSCKDDTFCLDEHGQKLLTAICCAIGVSIGIFSALTTEFNFKENHKVNEALIEAVAKKLNCCGLFGERRLLHDSYIQPDYTLLALV